MAVALVAALGLLAAYGWLVWNAPLLLVPDLRSPMPTPSGTSPPALSPAERATAAYNARVLVLSLADATVVVAGLLYTARNYRLSHRGQVTDRFTKALERLGSSELYVRIGGIHALQQVLHDSPSSTPKYSTSSLHLSANAPRAQQLTTTHLLSTRVQHCRPNRPPTYRPRLPPSPCGTGVGATNPTR